MPLNFLFIVVAVVVAAVVAAVAVVAVSAGMKECAEHAGT